MQKHLEENPIYPLTHIIQIILKTRSQKELQVLAERLSIGLQDRDKKHIQDHYKYETDPVRQLIKGCFNLVLSATEGIKKIGPISDEEKHYLEQRFVKANELRKFCHLTIGNHSRSHETLGLCAQTYFEKEVLSSSLGITLRGNFVDSHQFCIVWHLVLGSF